MRLGLGCGWDRRTASVILGAILVDDSRGYEEGKRNASTGSAWESPTSVQLRDMVLPFVVNGTSARHSVVYLADETSTSKTSAASTKLATSEKRGMLRVKVKISVPVTLEMYQRLHESLLAHGAGCLSRPSSV